MILPNTSEIDMYKNSLKLDNRIETLKLMAMEDYSKDNNMDFSIWTEKELKIK